MTDSRINAFVLDTNVLIRIFVNDQSDQHQRASALMLSGAPLHILPSVLLESEWVLRHAYGLSRQEIHQAFQLLLGNKQVTCDYAERISKALNLYKDGLDFGDAIHLVLAEPCTAFLTFDKRLISRHTGAAFPVREPSSRPPADL